MQCRARTVAADAVATRQRQCAAPGSMKAAAAAGLDVQTVATEANLGATVVNQAHRIVTARAETLLGTAENDLAAAVVLQ